MTAPDASSSRQCSLSERLSLSVSYSSSINVRPTPTAPTPLKELKSMVDAGRVAWDMEGCQFLDKRDISFALPS